MSKTIPYGQNYIKKIKSMRRFIGKSSLSPGVLLAPYRGQSFKDGPSKLELFKQVLECQLGEECEKYMNSFLGTPEFSHNRDSRTPVEYGTDLVLGWLKEDVVVALLAKFGMSAGLAGADAGRDFLQRSKVRSNSDLTVSFSGKSRLVETVYDASETWRNQDRCDLRDEKLPKIRDQRGIVLGIDVVNAEAFVYCPIKNADLKVSYNPCHWSYGRKPVYSIHGVSGITVPLPDSFPILAGLIGGGE